MKNLFTKLQLVILLVISLTYSSCRQQNKDLMIGSTTLYTIEIQNYLRDLHDTNRIRAGYGDSIMRKIDLNGVEKIAWKKDIELIIAPMRDNNSKKATNITFEVKNKRIVSASMFEFKITGSTDDASKQLKSYLETNKFDFTGSVQVTTLKKNFVLQLLKYDVDNGNLKRAEYVRPKGVRLAGSLTREGVPTISSIDDPTERCVDWYRFYYDPSTGLVYDMVYLYSVCTPTEGTPGGGSGNTTEYEYQDPCARAQALKDSVYKEKLGLLKYAAENMNSESLWVNGNRGAGLTWNLATGNPNEHFVNHDFSTYQLFSINSVMHNHFEGGMNIFSPDDLKSMWVLMNENRMADAATFNYTVITNQQTTYTLQIANAGTFMTWGQSWFGSAVNFELFKQQYQNFYEINLTNGNSTNKNNFLDMLRVTNAGLTLLTGNFSTLNTWRPSILNNSGEFTTIPCN